MPNKLISIDESKLKFLDPDSAYILFAVAEAVIGEQLRVKVPNFIPMIDDYVGFQRRSQREALAQGSGCRGLIVSVSRRTLRASHLHATAARPRAHEPRAGLAVPEPLRRRRTSRPPLFRQRSRGRDSTGASA